MQKNFEYVYDFYKQTLGLSVHLGLYSVAAKGECYLRTLDDDSKQTAAYFALAKKFAPKKDWAKDVVATAKAAGARYVVLTARHHDGFSLYDTCGLSDFDSVHSACGRDLVVEFVAECNAAGVQPFFYHTLTDWHNADYKQNPAAYYRYLSASIELLCTRYGQIGGFWFDGGNDDVLTAEQKAGLYALVHKHQPNAVVMTAKIDGACEDVDCVATENGEPEAAVTTDRPRVGQLCESLADHWGYAERDFCVKSVKQLTSMLVRCRANGCNLLLNVGLKGNGSFTELDKATLKAVGKWINLNGKFLYDATPADIRVDGATGFKSGDDYFVAVDDVPMSAYANADKEHGSNKIKLSVNRPIVSAKWLDSGKNLRTDCFGNLSVAPFDYGTSLGVRVAKVLFKQPVIGFLGDSITEGVGASDVSKRFSSVLCEMLGAKECNYGVGGTRIAAQRSKSDNEMWDEYFLRRAKTMTRELDFLFVMGGTNDYGHGDAPMGHEGDLSDYTFCGALNNLLKYLTDNYPAGKICFVLPLPRYNEESLRGDGNKYNGQPLSEYRRVIAEFCAKYDIDCLDLSDVFPEPQTVGDELTVDGLHPNDVGYRVVAEQLYEYLRNKGM